MPINLAPLPARLPQDPGLGPILGPRPRPGLGLGRGKATRTLPRTQTGYPLGTQENPTLHKFKVLAFINLLTNQYVILVFFAVLVKTNINELLR
jgi:hypothetical protein